jgi:hypothetical protein
MYMCIFEGGYRRAGAEWGSPEVLWITAGKKMKYMYM